MQDRVITNMFDEEHPPNLIPLKTKGLIRNSEGSPSYVPISDIWCLFVMNKAHNRNW